MEDEALRILIQEKLRDGRLPLDHIPRIWGGPSDGERCDACGELVLDSLVIEGIASAVGGKQSIQMHLFCFVLCDEERREPHEGDPRRAIEAALARRKDEFALSRLVLTADGYIVKFRLGAEDVVRTAVEARVFEDSSRIDRILEGVRLTFKALSNARAVRELASGYS